MGPEAADDNLLVRRVCLGERGAYRQIVERHQGRLYYLGLRFFHQPQDAEDFAQDVFLRAFERLGSFRGEVPFSAWLYRLAFNLAVNRWRVNLRRMAALRPAAPGGEEPEDRAAGGADPERAFLEGELKGRVEEAVKRLPDIQQLLLRLHFHDGLPYPQIAEITGIPVNTIKSHVFRAKKAIRRLLPHLRPGPEEETTHE